LPCDQPFASLPCLGSFSDGRCSARRSTCAASGMDSRRNNRVQRTGRVSPQAEGRDGKKSALPGPGSEQEGRRNAEGSGQHTCRSHNEGLLSSFSPFAALRLAPITKQSTVSSRVSQAENNARCFIVFSFTKKKYPHTASCMSLVFQGGPAAMLRDNGRPPPANRTELLPRGYSKWYCYYSTPRPPVKRAGVNFCMVNTPYFYLLAS